MPSFTTPSASDACDQNPSLTFSDSSPQEGTCANNYSVTRTWTATDACHNSSTASQTITVVDTHAPEISPLPPPSTFVCPAMPSFTTPSASDACDQNPSLTFSDSSPQEGTCANNYSVTRTWTATDACHNSSTASQTITVVDTHAPKINALPPQQTIQCKATPVFTR